MPLSLGQNAQISNAIDGYRGLGCCVKLYAPAAQIPDKVRVYELCLLSPQNAIFFVFSEENFSTGDIQIVSQVCTIVIVIKWGKYIFQSYILIIWCFSQFFEFVTVHFPVMHAIYFANYPLKAMN